MYKNFNDGMIEIITGPMFSGKSEELLKKIRILEYAKLKPLVIKPIFDSRFSDNEIISRAGIKNKTFTIKEPKEIYELLTREEYKAVLIDEAHFFDKSLVKIADDLANRGYLVVIAGLDQNYLREPFGPMPELMAIAEKIIKLQAICVICQHAASTSYRIIKSNQEHLLGDSDEYQARCRKCHFNKL